MTCHCYHDKRFHHHGRCYHPRANGTDCGVCDDLAAACWDLFDAVAETLRLPRLVDWLTRKLGLSENGESSQ